MILAMEVEDHLIARGFNVIGIAASAAQALKLAELHKPLVAVVDIRLEGGETGLDVAAALLEKWGTRSVVASAHARADLGVAADVRVSAWLIKPYSMDRLCQELLKAAQEKSAS